MQYSLNKAHLHHKWPAKVIEVISRLPNCAGQAAGAIPAFSQVMVEGAPELLKKIPTSECPDIWIRPSRQMTRTVGKIEDPVVPLWRNLYGHQLAGPLWERPLEIVLLESEWEKVPNWEWLFIENSNSFYRYMWTMFKMIGNKQNWAPMWKTFLKNVDLDEPTSFLDYVYLGCTQHECKPNETLIEKFQDMFESRISAGAIEILPGWDNSHAKTVAWSFWFGRTCWGMRGFFFFANWQTKRQSNCTKFQALVWTITKSRKKSLNQLEKISEGCSQIVLKCLYLARIGGPDIV